MGLDDDLSDDSGSILSIDNDLDFKTAVARKRGSKKQNQPRAKTKTVYLQLSGDKYRCAVRSDATWEQLKAAIEARLGLPPAIASLASIRGARDGALIRTGNDIEDGEYLDVKLDLRELAKSSTPEPPSPPRQAKTYYDDNNMIIPNLNQKSWVQSTNPKSISLRCFAREKKKKQSEHENKMHQQPSQNVSGKALNNHRISPWVQAVSGTTILAPVVTSNKMGVVSNNRPSSAPSSRPKHSQNNHEERDEYHEEERGYGGRSWSRPPQNQNDHHQNNYFPNVMSTDNEALNNGGGPRRSVFPSGMVSKSRIARPSSAPPVRSVITNMHPVMPMALGATEVMSNVFSNPMDPRQRQQFLQMGQYETQRVSRSEMASKLNTPHTDQIATPPPQQSNTPKNRHNNNNNKSDPLNETSDQSEHRQIRMSSNESPRHHQSGRGQGSSPKSYGGVYFNKCAPTHTAPQTASKKNQNSSRSKPFQSSHHHEGGKQSRKVEKSKSPTAQIRREKSPNRGSSSQPWLPTRNCNHRSAIISEEYPIMSHDGVGGPSVTRANRCRY
mmetsp:Transcript_17366/g.22541  ORF Transcript_17366/g.22541 Transcript_17366/m.22541 type:complete len:555 (-) Transcript_17366:135-1799(-)